LRHFLRASFDQHERALGLLEEELTIVRMYLDIEMLRFGSFGAEECRTIFVLLGSWLQNKGRQ
jgi:hypothetical protein